MDSASMTAAAASTTEGVEITITRTTYSKSSIVSRINVASSTGEDSFAGFALESTAPPNEHLPVPPGTYAAFIRTDHDPHRIELRDVPNAENVQIHVGNTVADVIGCFAVGEATSPDFVSDSRAAMAKILHIVEADGAGRIKVAVIGPAKARTSSGQA